MNRNRLLLVGTLALVLAALTSMGVYRVLQTATVSADGPKVNVVVAAADLSVGQALTSHELKTVVMPATELPSGTFSRVEELEGRGVILPMARNELVLASKLASAESGAGLPSMIPPGMRAVSVKVNDVVAVAGFVQPGTRVDVLVTGDPEKDRDPGKILTTTILHNVQVLASGTRLQRDATGEARSVPVITLLVNPEDAQKLTLASQEGRIQLTLRNPLDTDSTKTAVLQNRMIYGHVAPRPAARKATPAVVVPPPSSTYVVEMIHGTKRSESTFD